MKICSGLILFVLLTNLGCYTSPEQLKEEPKRVQCNCIYCSCGNKKPGECRCTKKQCEEAGCKCNKWKKD
jgi:hypothetical protein